MTSPVSQSLNGAQNSINNLELRQNTVSSASVCFVGINAAYDQHISWSEKERAFRSELEKSLNSWEAEITDENRQEAKLRIENFLNDESKNTLDLSSLSLASLPPIFNTDPFIKRLTKLDISHNRLTSLPSEIGRLQALQLLGVSNNQLTSLPAEIGGLQALQGLGVSNNRLTSLPSEIGRLQALQLLKVSSNQLTSLPSEIGGLQALQRLQVSSNQLTSLPAEIGGLHALKHLWVFSNQLTSLPAEIGGLRALQRLGVSNNQLTYLPSEIGWLQELQKLDVARNQLAYLPSEIGRLRALQRLGVSNNQLTYLPSEIGRLQELQKLDVARNWLTSLPSEIGGLQALQRLDVSHNNILIRVPREIFDLPSGCEIELEGVGLSEAVLARIRETCSAVGYQGPRISFSMVHAQQAGPSGEQSIEELLGDLFKLVNAEPKEFSNLLNSSDENKCNLKMWLARLSITADYEKGGESRKAFAGKVLKYLHEAEDHEQFREVFL